MNKFVNDNKSLISKNIRKAPRISIPQLKNKIEEIMLLPNPHFPQSVSNDVNFQIDLSVFDLGKSGSKWSKLAGYHTLNNGFTFYGVLSQSPYKSQFFYLVYWDGSKLRLYIPIYGNLINIDFKTSLGNEGMSPLSMEKERNLKATYGFKENLSKYSQYLLFHNYPQNDMGNDEAITEDIKLAISLK